MDLNIVNIVFILTTDDPHSLMPRLYDVVRKFDSCFRSVSCSKNNILCKSCEEEAGHCAYRSVFNQSLSTDPDVLRRHQKPTLPFSFKIRQIAPVSSCIELCLVIVGNAIQHVSAFRHAVDLMVVSVSENTGLDVSVSGTWCLDYQGGRHELNAASNSLVLLSGLEILESTHHSDKVKIYLDSPLRLLSGGSIAHSPDFGLLFRSQLRRCSSLFAYYGEEELELDYVFMSEAASKVTSVGADLSFRKPDWSMPAGHEGLLGSGEFSNLSAGMLPLLKLGSYFNAGKGATYGMGAYRIEGV